MYQYKIIHISSYIYYNDFNTAQAAITNAQGANTVANVTAAKDNIKRAVKSYTILLDAVQNIEEILKNDSQFNAAKQTAQTQLNNSIATNIGAINQQKEICFKYVDMNTSNIDNISTKYDYILNKSLLDVLYNVVCPNLVKNSVLIYENRSDENAFEQQSIQQILTEYFDRFETAPVTIDKKVIDYLKKNVTSYFSSFTDRAIKLWYINAENIFKYFINMHRIIQTKRILN